MKTFVVLLFVACIVVASARYVWVEDEKVEKKAHKGNEMNTDLTRLLRLLLRKDTSCTKQGEDCRDDCCEGLECRSEGIMPIWTCYKIED